MSHVLVLHAVPFSQTQPHLATWLMQPQQQCKQSLAQQLRLVVCKALMAVTITSKEQGVPQDTHILRQSTQASMHKA